MIKRICSILLFIILIISASLTVVHASDSVQTIETYISDLTSEQYNSLYINREITEFYSKNGSLRIIPETPLKYEIIKELSSVDCESGVEALYIIPNRKEKELSKDDLNNFMLKLYNTLNSVSTLKNVEYFSVSRNKMRILFRESYAINNPQDKKKIPDSTVDRIPEKREVFVFQEDSTFGDVISEITYRSSDEGISLSIINIQPIKYGFFRAVAAYNMQIHLIIIPCKNYILFYGTGAVNPVNIPGIRGTIKKSIYNRINAMYNWFCAMQNDDTV